MPKYAVLAAKLRQDILGGKFRPGECVPSQEQLVNKHKVALATARQAVKLLQDEGLLESVHGKGVYVRDSSEGTMPAVRRKDTIGFLAAGSSVSDPANHLIQVGIQKYGRTGGARFVFDAYFGDQPGEEEHIAEWSKGLSGVVVTGFVDENLLAVLRKNIRHIVIIGETSSAITESDIGKITFDFKSAVELGVSYLAVLGHKKILGVARRDVQLPVIYDAFEAGMMEAAQDAHISGEMLGYTMGDVAAFASAIVKMPQRPTAIISNGAQSTYKLMTQLAMAGVKVPEQISLVAIGDMRLIEEFTPRLTCINVNTERLGALALEAILRAIEFNVCTFQEVVGTLRLGETCVAVKESICKL